MLGTPIRLLKASTVAVPYVPLLVFLIDLALLRRHRLVIVGMLDESAHVMTALLAHLAFRFPVTRQAILGTLVGATLLDLDHVPQFLGSRILAARTERPVTHSLGGLGVVVAVALASPRSLRQFLAFTAFGVLTQLVRDMATGGVPLAWPLSEQEVSLPYGMYGGLVFLLATSVLARGDGRRHSVI